MNKEIESLVLIYERTILKESDNTEFNSFIENRLSGVEKIADSAKEKGGDALLTYEHFNVKIPYYKKASKEFNKQSTYEELKTKIDKLKSKVEDMSIEQTNFQRLVGEIEVLGELLIKFNSIN